VKADTIDFYHVYYNSVNIQKFNLYNVNDSNSIITFSIDILSDLESFSIKYYSDSQNSKTSTFISLMSLEDEVIESVFLKENSFSFSVENFLNSVKINGKEDYKFVYNTSIDNDKSFQYVLFYLRLE
jgi:hypothetical protein